MSKTPALDLLLHDLSLLTPGGYAVGLHIRYVSPLIVVNTYPAQWQEVYTAKVYGLRDPTLAWGLSHIGVRRWSAVAIGFVGTLIESVGEQLSNPVTHIRRKRRRARRGRV